MKSNHKIELKSIWTKLIHEINNTETLKAAKEICVINIGLSRINPEHKQLMMRNIEKQTTKDGLIKYAYNSMLQYEGLGLNRFRNQK